MVHRNIILAQSYIDARSIFFQFLRKQTSRQTHKQTNIDTQTPLKQYLFTLHSWCIEKYKLWV